MGGADWGKPRTGYDRNQWYGGKSIHWPGQILLTHSQRTHGVITTSLLHQNVVATSFWRNDDVVIASCRNKIADIYLTLRMYILEWKLLPPAFFDGNPYTQKDGVYFGTGPGFLLIRNYVTLPTHDLHLTINIYLCIHACMYVHMFLHLCFIHLILLKTTKSYIILQANTLAIESRHNDISDVSGGLITLGFQNSWSTAKPIIKVAASSKLKSGCPAMSPHKIPWLFLDISLDHFVVFPDHETYYRHFITALTLIFSASNLTNPSPKVAITK